MKFNCAEEFVAALSDFSSWEKCLYIETYKYKPAPSIAPAAAPQPASALATPEPASVEAENKPAVVEPESKN